jgi:hypothetical protein
MAMRLVGIPTSVEAAEADAARGDWTVQLAGEEPVVLAADDERARGYAEVLAELRRQGLPAFLEVDRETATVTRLLVPVVARVSRMITIDRGLLGVELEPSHARHLLRATTEDAEAFEALLRRAVDAGTAVVVTRDDDGSILDVRPWDGEVPFLPPRPPPRSGPRGLFTRLVHGPRQALLVLWWYLRPISRRRARQVFDAVVTLSCHPINVPVPCIPFLYPDDGCWGRAHEMARLLHGMSAPPRKVWIQGWLTVATANNPLCEVTWIWHVAPTLRVSGVLWFGARTVVIDPSLFDGPVGLGTWKGKQQDANASLTHTGPEIFYLFSGQTDPDNSLTEGVLAQYRAALKARSLHQGPPPYAHCPA